MKAWLFLACCSVPLALSAQRKPLLAEKALNVRALALPYVLGSANGMFYTGGLEYIFGRDHGIGLDFSYNDYNQPDDPNPVTGIVPPRLYSVTRGIVLSYRRYLPLHDGRQNRYRPYLSAFFRYGNRSFHPESGYLPADMTLENRVKYDEQQYSIGIMGGLIPGYRFGRLNLDLGAGPFFKLKTAQDQRLETGGFRTYETAAETVGVRFTLTVGYLYALRMPSGRARK